jgi:hypothetical protein
MGYKQNLDNGVIGKPRGVDPSTKDKGLCFHSLVDKGENPNGFSAVVPTGSTAHDSREGKNKNYSWDPVSGPRWSSNEMWSGNKSGE